MSTFRFCSLGSGSKGNGTLIKSRTTTILVDCGFSKRETTTRLGIRGINPGSIDAILVTHLHGDHSRGVGVFTRAFPTNVFTSYGSMYGRQKPLVSEHLFRPVESGIPFTIGDITISPVSVPHDCVEPVQFVFECEGHKLGILTDIGHISSAVEEAYQGCDVILVESNHDTEMLWNGSYPWRLKRRISGDFGHLSNAQTIDFIDSVRSEKLNQVIIAHISEENNSQDVLRKAFSSLSRELPVRYATQDSGSDWINVGVAHV